jgi:hypothetical protein
MSGDFFEKEFVTVCDRFNQTFGKQSVCNRKTRDRVIFAIIHMGMLNKKIGQTRDKYKVRKDIHYDNDYQANRRSGQRSNVR